MPDGVEALILVCFVWGVAAFLLAWALDRLEKDWRGL